MINTKSPDQIHPPPLVSVLDQTKVIGSQGGFILILTEKGGFVREGPPIILFPL